jgi:hypothetical protein
MKHLNHVLFGSIIYMLTLTVNAQTWSSVGGGMPTYTSANCLYNHPITNELVIGNSSSTLVKWDGTSISTFGPASSYNDVMGLVDYNYVLYAKFNTSTIMQAWNYVNSWQNPNGGNTIMSLTPRVVFNNLVWMSGGAGPCQYDGNTGTAISGFTGGSMHQAKVFTYQGNTTLFFTGKSSHNTLGTDRPVYYRTTTNSNWQALGNSGLGLYGTSTVNIAVLNDSIFIGGSFNSSSTFLMKWNGSSWVNAAPFLVGWNVVKDLCVFNGKLYYATYNGTNSSIYEYFNGASTLIGTANGGMVNDMEVHGNHLYIAGTFTDVNSISGTERIARWTNIAPLSLAVSSTSVSCFGGNNGTANASTTGGVAPYSYSWSNGATTQSVNGLTAGSYTVTVTDATNNSMSTTVTVTQPTQLNVSTTKTDETTAGANDGTANATPSGGTSPYSYSWSNGATTQSVTGLAPGNYTVTVTDTNGCITNSVVTIDPAITTGIGQLSKGSTFIIYPNPSNGAFNMTQSADIEVFDVYGKLVLKTNTNSFILPEGLYSVRVGGMNFKLICNR